MVGEVWTIQNIVMPSSKSTHHPKIKLGGIKLSPELAQFSFAEGSSTLSDLVVILGELTQKKINLSFLWLNHSSHQNHHSFCAASSYSGQIHGWIGNFKYHSTDHNTKTEVGTITIFPHRNSITFLSSIISLFLKKKIPIFSMNTSISAVFINTDYKMLDVAAAEIQSHFELPTNHAPFRDEIVIDNQSDGNSNIYTFKPIETKAAYWESTIQIYNINIVSNLSLININLSLENPDSLHNHLLSLTKKQDTFIFFGAQENQEHSLQFSIIIDITSVPTLIEEMKTKANQSGSKYVSTYEEVEIITFFGPHFQDRYGIALTAFKAIEAKGFTLLAAGCSGTSIYLVVPQGTAEPMGKCLSQYFIVPKTGKQS